MGVRAGLLWRLQSASHPEHQCTSQVNNSFHPLLSFLSFVLVQRKTQRDADKHKHLWLPLSRHRSRWLSRVSQKKSGQKGRGTYIWVGSIVSSCACEWLVWRTIVICFCLSFRHALDFWLALVWASVWTEQNHCPSLIIILNVRYCCLILSLFEPLYMYLFKKEHVIKFLISCISYFVGGNWLGIEFWTGLLLKLVVQALVHCPLQASVAKEESEVWFYSFF